jgi:predicted ATPase
VGTLIYHWQKARDPRLAALKESGRRMGLFREITAVRMTDTQIDVRIRAGSGNRWDSLPEAGHGVSQVLPVLVALQAAEPGQLVYVEHPESCLHPRAEVALAEEFADAVLRGVRLVAEIHSQLLLLNVQTLVAEGKLSPEAVKLHWFERDGRDETAVHSADIDKAGAYGDWPEDLAAVYLQATGRYLDTHEARRRLS